MSTELNDTITKIFVSYSRGDAAFARELNTLLSRQPNLRVFDTRSLSAGGEWVDELKREIAECDIFMVLVSPSSVASSWVLQEAGAAWALEKPIIAVIAGADADVAVPLPLKYMLSVDLKKLQDQTVVNQIVQRYSKKGTASHKAEV